MTNLDTILDAPSFMQQAPLLVMVVVGLVLWLFGGKIVRSAILIVGVLLGALVGLMGSTLFGGPVWLGPAVGAVLGGLAAWFFFRVWVAISAGVMFGLIGPVVVLMVHTQAPPPPVAADVESMMIDTSRAPSARGSGRVDPSHLARQQLEQLGKWWDGLSPALHRTVAIASLAGFVAGLLVGFLKPKGMAAAQAAIIGALLIVLGVKALLFIHQPAAAAWIPTGRRGLPLTVGLITAAGLMIQWTLLRRRADKGTA